MQFNSLSLQYLTFYTAKAQEATGAFLPHCGASDGPPGANSPIVTMLKMLCKYIYQNLPAYPSNQRPSKASAEPQLEHNIIENAWLRMKNHMNADARGPSKSTQQLIERFFEE